MLQCVRVCLCLHEPMHAQRCMLRGDALKRSRRSPMLIIKHKDCCQIPWLMCIQLRLQGPRTLATRAHAAPLDLLTCISHLWAYAVPSKLFNDFKFKYLQPNKCRKLLCLQFFVLARAGIHVRFSPSTQRHASTHK